FFSPPPRPPRSTLFPYTTLFRSQRAQLSGCARLCNRRRRTSHSDRRPRARVARVLFAPGGGARSKALVVVLDRFRDAERRRRTEDRKSTRLNSSHLVISYAVFCL